MTNYGNKIKYDCNIPIKMSLPIDDTKIWEIFSKNYRLPLFSEEITLDGHGRKIYTFNKSVDCHTFLRHLRTATSDYYDTL